MMKLKPSIVLKWSSIAILLFTTGIILYTRFIMRSGHMPQRRKAYSASSPKSPGMAKKARYDHFYRMLKDPATNKIPPNIRQKELNFAGNLKQMAKSPATSLFNWDEAGPEDVGGRTRALGIDITDPNIIIAGGVSGGVWKSTDHGQTWSLKNDPSQQLSITSLVQDIRPGYTKTWYYASGEFIGNSASDRGFTAFYYGSGLYKSTDNGETWTRIQNAGKISNWDTSYDLVSKITINPNTGTLFLAANGIGILRSDDGGENFDIVLGSINDHYYTDVTVTVDGRVVACLSETGYNDAPADEPGIYRSSNNGNTWINITPSTFPETHRRSVLATAPSNPNSVYVLTYVSGSGKEEDIRFHKINLTNGKSEDRTEYLPDLGIDSKDYPETQSGYNMVVAVKPDDEDFVLIGSTSLFRSNDGFSTSENSTFYNWIGGYFQEPIYRYPNLHPDQHVIVFDPADPNKVWCGHDGGLSFCGNITAASDDKTLLSWEDKNNRYITTQFYTVALSQKAKDPQILGGTQDNGTPYFIWDGVNSTASVDASGADGSYCYAGDHEVYVSWQQGNIIRFHLDAKGYPDLAAGWTVITPIGASGQLFINPFTVNPSNEDMMFYPAGNTLWCNNALSSIPDFEDSTSVGWSQLTDLDLPSGYIISALAMSNQNPAHTLYYAGYSNGSKSLIYRLDNANTSTSGAVPIDISSAEDGVYVHSIAVNPEDGNEIIVVMSNYNIIGLYHSTNSGENFRAVEGNLKGNVTNPGPSLRSATILPLNSETLYVLGTSIGVFTTNALNGANTEWIQESTTGMGNVVVSMVTSRKSDGRVAAGTHGRGIWVGDLSATDVAKDGARPNRFALAQNYPNPFNPITTIEYTLPFKQNVELKIFNEMGQEMTTLVNGTQDSGKHSVRFDGKNLASGIYIYTLKTGKKSLSKKFALLK